MANPDVDRFIISAPAIRASDSREGTLRLTDKDILFEGARPKGVQFPRRDPHPKRDLLFKIPLHEVVLARCPQLLTTGKRGFREALRIEWIGGGLAFWTNAAEDFSSEINKRVHEPEEPPHPSSDSASQNYLATAYRLRTQSIADYQNAVPVPAWPGYIIALGTASFGGGSAVLAVTRLAGLTDWFSVGVLWVLGSILIIYGVFALRESDTQRRLKYDQGLQLFDLWARSVGEPFEGTRELQYTRADMEREIEETRVAMGSRVPNESNPPTEANDIESDTEN